MSAQPLPRLTPDEYLAAERAAEYKSEYYDGFVYAMAGGSPNHSLIALNTGAELRDALHDRDSSVYQSDPRPLYTQELFVRAIRAPMCRSSAAQPRWRISMTTTY